MTSLERPGFKKQVCVKEMRSPTVEAKRYTAMLRDEAALVAWLHHPNLVEVFDVGEVEGALFLAMELVRGFTLGSLLAALLSRVGRSSLTSRSARARATGRR